MPTPGISTGTPVLAIFSAMVQIPLSGSAKLLNFSTKLALTRRITGIGGAKIFGMILSPMLNFTCIHYNPLRF
jgi:hypothetical protein